MPRESGFPWRATVSLSVAVILSLALTACAGAEPVAPTQSPAAAPQTAVAAGPTEAPAAAAPAATQEPSEPETTATAMPAEATTPTAEPTLRAASDDPEPAATALPTEIAGAPNPTAGPALNTAPGDPEPTATAAPTEAAGPTVTLTTLPPTPCERERGGEVGNCAPEFAGTQEWVNSPALAMEELRGKVVLIDFWTYSCINCIRTLPFLQTWHTRYADQGLVIIGVHTPEFEFEKVYSNVVDATVDMGVAWPVVQDNDYAVWRSYDNRFWPAKYLIDKNGVIRYRHFGEGKYAETEEQIRVLLEEAGAEAHALNRKLPKDQQVDPAYLTALGTSDARRTPELFAGWDFVFGHYRAGRGLYIGQIEPYQEAAQASYDAGDQQGVTAEFVQPAQLQPDVIYFHGPWAIGPESAVHARETEEYTDLIILVYSARSVNTVLTSESGEPYKVVVTVNNEYLTAENKGEDVTIGENGESYVMVTSPKAYRLVEHAEFQEGQTLAMSSLSDDFGLFSFTFGTYRDGF